MEKLTRTILAELAKTKTMISFLEQRRYVGGGTGTQEDPFLLWRVHGLLSRQALEWWLGTRSN